VTTLDPWPCEWCGAPTTALDARGIPSRFCGKRHRQTAYRIRKRTGALGPRTVGTPLRFRYHDPPYPGHAWRYKDQDSYGGEVDHVAMIGEAERRRVAGELAGYAISTSAAALRFVLGCCPPCAHVCPWVKPSNMSATAFGLSNSWEPVIVVGGRVSGRGGVPDYLVAATARGDDCDLVGRKPLAFSAFLFRALGMLPGDVLEDAYPGSGDVGKAWDEVSRSSTAVIASSP
jgi:hypothetical protein